ncbi:dethiobiotin synthase [Campylobacter sp. 9BO]|uniref:dethiobiotin synthase n=1 Tax=Campylobacter sp. 9BO TaxID=3424759 RepID=UPI003D33B8A4
MSKNLFILGTGTDVGKTYASALIVKKFLQNGINALYYKPVSSGNLPLANGTLKHCDIEFVRQISGLEILADELSSYAYENAYSPHLAARIEGSPAQISKIKDKFNHLQKSCEYLLIEGAGGAVTPLNFSQDGSENLMLLDLVKQLCPSVLLVACARLGGINAAVLTCEYLRNNGVAIQGIILNHFNEQDPICVDNYKMIEILCKTSVVDTISSSQIGLNLSIDKLKSLFV